MFTWISIEREWAVAMSHTLFRPLQSEKFNSFLLAPLGEEQNGMTLSLLSALARLNVDPWEETAVLAAIPKERARLKLAALIGATTNLLRDAPNADVIAARLIDLLPSAAATTIAAHAIPLRKSSPSSVEMVVGIVFLIMATYATTHTVVWPFFSSSIGRTNDANNSGSPP